MTELPPELQKVLDVSTDKPPVIIDGRTQETYVLVRAEVYAQLTQKPSTPAQQPVVSEIPEGILRSRAALRKDLPGLLAHRRNWGKLICYRGNERVGIGDYVTLMRECNRRGFRDDEFVIVRIRPDAGSEVEEEIDRSYV
jgi:hypothetical protein